MRTLRNAENKTFVAVISENVEYFYNGQTFDVADYAKLSPADQKAFDNLSDSFADGELFYADTDEGEYAYDRNPWQNPVWNCRAEVIKKAYNDVDHDGDNEKFPLFCREQSNFQAYILIDTYTGAVWADTQDHNSCSERVWKGKDVRFGINGGCFMTWEDVSWWVDNHLGIILDYLSDKISENRLLNCFYDDTTSEYAIYYDFAEYTNNYCIQDLVAELEAADFSCMQYAKDLQDTHWSNCYFYGYAEVATLAEEIYDYFMENLDDEDLLKKIQK